MIARLPEYPKSGLNCYTFFLFSFFFHLTYSRWTSSLPSCLWSQRIFPSLPGSRLTIFLSRCKFSTLTTRQPMVEFYLLTFPRFPLRKKEHKSYFGKDRTHDFRTSRCAAYLLDHSGDDCCKLSTQCLSRELCYARTFGINLHLLQHTHGASSRSVSFFQGCLLELAQQLIATDVCTGEGYRLRPLDCLCPRRVL